MNDSNRWLIAVTFYADRICNCLPDSGDVEWIGLSFLVSEQDHDLGATKCQHRFGAWRRKNKSLNRVIMCWCRESIKLRPTIILGGHNIGTYCLNWISLISDLITFTKVQFRRGPVKYETPFVRTSLSILWAAVIWIALLISGRAIRRRIRSFVDLAIVWVSLLCYTMVDPPKNIVFYAFAVAIK